MSKDAPDDLPEGYLTADPNTGFDPHDTDVSADDALSGGDGPREFGSRLAARKRGAVREALQWFRYEDGTHYIKTRHLADRLDMPAQRCKCMMHVFEADGWVERWGASSCITWHITIDPPDDMPDPPAYGDTTPAADETETETS